MGHGDKGMRRQGDEETMGWGDKGSKFFRNTIFSDLENTNRAWDNVPEERKGW